MNPYILTTSHTSTSSPAHFLINSSPNPGSHSPNLFIMPIGDKIKNVGANIKDALTPGHQDSTTGTGTGTYTEKGTTGYGTTGNTTGLAGTGAGYGTTGTAGTTGTTGLTGSDTNYSKTTETYGSTGGTAGAYGTEGVTDHHSGHGHSHTSGDTKTHIESAARQGKEQVLGQDYYTNTEDRSLVKERVEQIREHRPVEKEFVVETRATGNERDLVDQRSTEHLGTRERVIEGAERVFDGKTSETHTTGTGHHTSTKY
ncbi:hypothetical protein ACKKBG_A34425 [Auxenochlorella protothecoides x Auxenochlorella symbiontica]